MEDIRFHRRKIAIQYSNAIESITKRTVQQASFVENTDAG